MTPPTPLFPVESPSIGSGVSSYPIYDAIIKAAADKVLKETNKNHVSVSVGAVPKPYSLYNPHNYRQYFDFDRSTFSIQNHALPVVDTTAWRLINSTEVCFDDYLGFRIVIKKHQAELTLKSSEWKVVYLEPIEGIHPQIVKICQEIHERAVAVLKKFIAEYGGASQCRLLNMTCENKVKQEDAVDLIPDRMTFRNEVIKKVYMEKNVEFSDPVAVSNYLTNRGIEKISPELNTALRGISDGLLAVTEIQRGMMEQALTPLTEQIKLHLKVQEQTLKTQKEMAKTMKAIRNDLKDNKRMDKVRELKARFGW